MRRIAAACVMLWVLAGFAHAQQNAEMQQRIAAVREAAAHNQQSLRSYSWISTTEILLKGEVKNTKIEQCHYGADGTVQKTELSEPPQQEQESRRRRRGGRLKEKIVAKKTAEMQQEMESAAALVHRYVPPSPEKIQAVVAAGGVAHTPSGGNQAGVRLANYEKAGDALTLTLDTASLALLHVGVDTWLNEPDQQVTLEVSFQTLSDGTSYPASTELVIPGDEIEVHIENSNYQRVDR